MNGYKKIIKSTKIRKLILNLLCFLPDNVMLPLQYRIKLGRKLDLKNPQRYTEKIQWYKMHYRNPIMHQCVDKYKVREYVKSKGLANILVPLIGKYDSIEQVEWDRLPNQFVIKTTYGGGGLNVIVCHDKTKIDFKEINQKLKTDSLLVKENSMGREWAYYGLQPGIIIEKLLIDVDNPSSGINDYKFFCYNGTVRYIVVDVDRYIGHKRNFYDCDWNNLDIASDCPKADRIINKPNNLAEMITVAEKLSDGFPYVRVDLYSVGEQVFFGELTFYPWSGYVQFVPDEWDYVFGNIFPLIDFKTVE